MPFLEWYLKQFAAAERKGGRRLLDFLDIHGYIAPDEVQFKSAGDTAHQQMRARCRPRVLGSVPITSPAASTTSRIWCRACATGSRATTPARVTAITEYNLGALDHINGAIAQADLLGVFGREGLDIAAIWAPPSEAEPGFYSFKIFSNYDDDGNGFGDVSVTRPATISPGSRSTPRSDHGDRALTMLVAEQVVRRPVEHDCRPGFSGAERRRGVSLQQLERRPDRAAAGSARRQDRSRRRSRPRR